jgi:hypothetical protein
MALSGPAALSRRNFLRTGALGAAGLMAGQALAPTAPAMAAMPATPTGIRPELLRRALAAADRHRNRIARRDLIGVVDFAAASNMPRLHLVDTINGRATSLLVSHGRGSDPAHTGWLSRFSNQDGSLASSSGSYLTGDTYYGKHGRSRRLIGLDGSNCNAETRGIVVHSAWYVSPQLAAQHGKIGRSEGCFAVSESELEMVLGRLGAGRMIYADKI